MTAFGDDRASLAAQASFFRLMRVVAPILAFIGAVLAWLAALQGSLGLTAPVTSPWQAATTLGLGLFPGGTLMIAHGLLHWTRRRLAAFWPSIKGHVLAPGPMQPFLLVSVVRFWYVVNGHRYEASIQARSMPAGAEVEVRYDPEDPELGLLAAGDAAVMVYLGFGLFALTLPFWLGPLLVWWGG